MTSALRQSAQFEDWCDGLEGGEETLVRVPAHMHLYDIHNENYMTSQSERSRSRVRTKPKKETFSIPL